MVTDDPKPFRQTSGRKTLARLIAESPQGLDEGRVLRWADQLAAAVDDLHARGRPHGSIDPSSVFIDEHDRAHLAAETRPRDRPTERDLLLDDGGSRKTRGTPSARSENDVRALAATLYEALGGDRLANSASGAPPPVVPGVSVQINVALLTVLSRGRGRRLTQAGDLARMLRGETAPAGRRRGAPKTWMSRAAVTLMTAAAIVTVVVGVRLWVGPAPARTPRAEPVTANDLRAADQEIKAALAARGRAQPAVALPATQEPEPRPDPRRALDRAAGAWRQVLAQAPEAWLDDDTVQSWCVEALTVADDAAAADRAGRHDEARADYELAALLLAEAWALHDQGVASLQARTVLAKQDEPRPEADHVPQEIVSSVDLEAHDAERDEAAAVTGRTAPDDPALENVEQTVVAAPAALEPQIQAPQPRPDAARERPRAGEVRVNSLSQTLILLEPGAFAMGSPHGEPLRNEGEWQHSVRITRAFWMARVEVTRGQFRSFVQETRYVTDAERAGWSHGLGEDGRWRQMDGIDWRDPGFTQTDSHPVVCVSLHDALAFCRWLSDREGRRYRLPTEAEWEFACRAGSASPFAWGDDVFDELARANAADKAWTDRFPEAIGFRWRDEWVHTSPVGRFPANAWGLFDMHGNITEWCLDRYAPYGVEAVEDSVEAEALSAGDPAPRVMRGGSYAATPAQCRAAHRDAGPPGSSFATVGFRIVMDHQQP